MTWLSFGVVPVRCVLAGASAEPLLPPAGEAVVAGRFEHLGKARVEVVDCRAGQVLELVVDVGVRRRAVDLTRAKLRATRAGHVERMREQASIDEIARRLCAGCSCGYRSARPSRASRDRRGSTCRRRSRPAPAPRRSGSAGRRRLPGRPVVPASRWPRRSPVAGGAPPRRRSVAAGCGRRPAKLAGRRQGPAPGHRRARRAHRGEARSNSGNCGGR